jgi:hypothetical protein
MKTAALLRRREKSVAYRKAQREAALARGLCQNCARVPHEPDLTFCRACLTLRSQRRSAIRVSDHVDTLIAPAPAPEGCTCTVLRGTLGCPVHEGGSK